MIKKLLLSAVCVAAAFTALAQEDGSVRRKGLNREKRAARQEAPQSDSLRVSVANTQTELAPMQADSVALETSQATPVALAPVEADSMVLETAPADFVPDSIAPTSPVKLTRRQKYDRGLAFDTKTPSMPKGLWVAGLNLGYSQHDNSGYGILLLSDINSKGHTINVSPVVHYVFANNQSIGIRFNYKRQWLDLENVELNIPQDLKDMILMDPDALRYQYNNHTYMGYISYRYYVGFGKSKRFLFFNEVQAGFGGGQQKEQSGSTDSGNYRRTTHQKSFNFRLGLAPGAAFFITNVMAIEVQIGLLGYEFKKLTQTSTNADIVDGNGNVVVESNSRTTSSISTNFDFLSIMFGTTFYL